MIITDIQRQHTFSSNKVFESSFSQSPHCPHNVLVLAGIHTSVTCCVSCREGQIIKFEKIVSDDIYSSYSMVFLCRSFDDYLLSSTFNPDLNANCEYMGTSYNSNARLLKIHATQVHKINLHSFLTRITC